MKYPSWCVLVLSLLTTTTAQRFNTTLDFLSPLDHIELEDDFYTADDCVQNYLTDKGHMLDIAVNLQTTRNALTCYDTYFVEVNRRKAEMAPVISGSLNKTLTDVLNYLLPLQELRREANAINAGNDLAKARWTTVVNRLDEIGLSEISELTKVDTDANVLRQALRQQSVASMQNLGTAAGLTTTYMQGRPDRVKQLTNPQDIEKVMVAMNTIIGAQQNPPLPTTLLNTRATALRQQVAARPITMAYTPMKTEFAAIVDLAYSATGTLAPKTTSTTMAMAPVQTWPAAKQQADAQTFLTTKDQLQLDSDFHSSDYFVQNLAGNKQQLLADADTVPKIRVAMSAWNRYAQEVVARRQEIEPEVNGHLAATLPQVLNYSSEITRLRNEVRLNPLISEADAKAKYNEMVTNLDRMGLDNVRALTTHDTPVNRIRQPLRAFDSDQLQQKTAALQMADTMLTNDVQNLKGLNNRQDMSKVLTAMETVTKDEQNTLLAQRQQAAQSITELKNQMSTLDANGLKQKFSALVDNGNVQSVLYASVAGDKARRYMPF